MKAFHLGALLALAACTHLTPFSPRALSGQTLLLRPGWSMALAVDGSVAGRPALVHLAVEEPLSRVTAGCFESPPETVARVDTGRAAPDAGALSKSRFQEQVVASNVHLGSRALGDVTALEDEAGATCELTLGSEVLIGFVLEVNPAGRTVTFHAQMPTAPVYRSEESVVLELTLDPKTDRPSLAVQLEGAGSPLTLPMVLATADGQVWVSAQAGRALAGSDVGQKSLVPRALSLAPEWALHHVVVSVREAPGDGPAVGSPDGEPPVPALSGALGADAWGHYRVLIDLRGQRLVLNRRPPPVEGSPGPESWTNLSSESTPRGSLVRFVSWQNLERGAQLPLEPGYVRLQQCRLGLTLGPEDPGASLEVAIPWPGLEKEMPECAQEVARVPAWTGELDVGAAPRACSGSCVYAQALASGRTLCHCAGRPSVVRTPTSEPAPDASVPDGPEPVDPPRPPRR
jgi:hypothetical protein